MSTKTAGSKTAADRTPSGPTARELDTAYRIHTLAHMVYGQIGAAPPWPAVPPAATHHEPAPGWQASALPPWPGPWGPPHGWPR